MQGTVKWFNAEKGYGFLEPDGEGNDIYAHISDVKAAGIATLVTGEVIGFDVESDARGKTKAVNLSPAAT